MSVLTLIQGISKRWILSSYVVRLETEVEGTVPSTYNDMVWGLLSERPTNAIRSAYVDSDMNTTLM